MSALYVRQCPASEFGSLPQALYYVVTCGSKYIVFHYAGEDRPVATVHRSPYCIALEDDASREDTI